VQTSTPTVTLLQQQSDQRKQAVKQEIYVILVCYRNFIDFSVPDHERIADLCQLARIDFEKPSEGALVCSPVQES
jgi:hypothetical protein